MMIYSGILSLKHCSLFSCKVNSLWMNELGGRAGGEGGRFRGQKESYYNTIKIKKVCDVIVNDTRGEKGLIITRHMQ